MASLSAWTAHRSRSVRSSSAAPKAQEVQEPTCVRQIKVVYAGYGEAQAVPCTTLVTH